RISAVRSANVSFLLFYSSPVPPRHPPPFPTRRSSDLVPCADRQPPSPRELRGPLLRGPHLLLVLRLLRLHRRLRIQRNEHGEQQDRKSTRLNSSHVSISYAVFCLKKKKEKE